MLVWDLSYIDSNGKHIRKDVVTQEHIMDEDNVMELLNKVLKIKDVEKVTELYCNQDDDAEYEEDEEDCEYDYDDAVAWLEDHGVSCDPGNSVGEYVCDWLDDIGDDNDGCYTYSDLEMILEGALKYKEEVEEEEEDE